MDTFEKYNEALEQAKKELAACGSMDCDAARLIFRLFPQLRDERMYYNKIIDYLLGRIDVMPSNINGRNTLVAWLEKQKINTEGDFGRGYDCGYQAGYAVAMNEMKPKVATATLDSEKQKGHTTERVEQIRKDLYQSGYNDGYQHGREDEK